MSVQAVDVSSYQSSSFSTAGLDAVIVKATEGTSYVNPRHAAQVAHARADSLAIGHYHFARPGSMTAQVAYFLKHAAPKAGDILAFDWEDTGVSGAEKDAWIKHAQTMAAAHRVILYCNRDFWLHRDHTSFAGDGLWIADPGAPAGHPRVNADWVFHQYSEAGGIDRDLASFKDRKALDTWAAKGTKPKPPSPAPRYEPYPGEHWFTVGRRSPVVAAMHERLVASGCSRYRSHTQLETIGSGDVASYEAWQRRYSADHHQGWTGEALKWPPGKESWDALRVPNV